MQSNLTRLRDTLEATPGAVDDLLVHFKQAGWVGISKNATAQQLIENALNRMKYDAPKYTVFIDMLNKMAGMDEVVSSIIEGK